MTQPTRLYAVRNTQLLDSHPPRIVEAENQAKAIRHVCKPFEAEPITALELAGLLVKHKDLAVERAGE